MAEKQIHKQKQSLLLTLGIIIIITVSIIMSISSSFAYQNTKENLINEIKNNAQKSILSLESNIATLITSYSINEYEKLIFNEIKNKNIYAIVVKDNKMGKIMDSKYYVTGKIRVSDTNIIDYNAQNIEHQKNLENCFFSTTANIKTPANEILGTVSIYITDEIINKELAKIIKETLINTFLLSILLVLFLFLSIQHYILKPISNIIDTINNSDKDGIPKTMIPLSNSREITELSNSMNTMISTIRKSRDILQKNEHRMEYLLRLSPIAVRIAKNRGEYVIFANNAYSKLLQQEKGTTSGRNPKNYYVDKNVYENIIQSLEKGEDIYNMLVELNIENKTVWALASYMNLNYDGEKAIIGWFYDVTNEKLNEAKLYKALELQSTIFDNSGYLMISTDKHGLIQQFNKEAEKLLGYKSEELINIHTPEVFHLKAEVIQRAEYFSKELNKKIEPGFSTFIAKTDLGLKNEYEWTYVSKSGEHIPIILTVTALKNKNNETYGYIGIAQDISQKKVLESQAKLASMGEMIGNIAHQWRQPLSMISTIASGIIVKNESQLRIFQ